MQLAAEVGSAGTADNYDEHGGQRAAGGSTHNNQWYSTESVGAVTLHPDGGSLTEKEEELAPTTNRHNQLGCKPHCVIYSSRSWITSDCDNAAWHTAAASCMLRLRESLACCSAVLQTVFSIACHHLDAVGLFFGPADRRVVQLTGEC